MYIVENITHITLLSHKLFYFLSSAVENMLGICVVYLNVNRILYDAAFQTSISWYW
jgi:hypothetical protein